MPFTAVTVVIRAHLALLSSKLRVQESRLSTKIKRTCSRHFTSACLMPVGGKNRLFYNRCAHMRQAHYKNCLQ